MKYNKNKNNRQVSECIEVFVFGYNNIWKQKSNKKSNKHGNNTVK